MIFDVDPQFANTDEWWQSIPEHVRPRKDQPFYHLLAENAETTYVAYVSEQNLLPDESGRPVGHPQVGQYFSDLKDGRYVRRMAWTSQPRPGVPWEGRCSTPSAGRGSGCRRGRPAAARRRDPACGSPAASACCG